ncbi:hypothetical protein ACPFUP_003702, partial [Vibrio cholerae]
INEDVSEDIEPEKNSPQERISWSWKSNSFPSVPTLLEPIDDGYYFNCKWIRAGGHNPNCEQILSCYITGKSAVLQVNLDVEARSIVNIKYKDSLPLSELVSAQYRSQGRLSQHIYMQNGVQGEQCSLVEALLNLEPVINEICEQFGTYEEVYDAPLTDEERQELSPVKLWKALADTEGQLRQSLQIESVTEDKLSDSGYPMYPYSCLDGRDLQIDSDDTYYAYQSNSEEKLGEVVVTETTRN